MDACMRFSGWGTRANVLECRTRREVRDPGADRAGAVDTDGDVEHATARLEGERRRVRPPAREVQPRGELHLPGAARLRGPAYARSKDWESGDGLRRGFTLPREVLCLRAAGAEADDCLHHTAG